MKSLFPSFISIPALAIMLAGCAESIGSASAVCEAGPATAVEGFPASVMLPAAAVLDDQSSGFPPEFATNNYQITAHSAAEKDAIISFYRCVLPQHGFPIISEEEGNFWLLRFGGPDIDDGSVLVGEGAADGEVSIQMFVIGKES